MSLYAGIPLPPLLICANTLASFTALLFDIVLCLYRPLRDGPIFFSSVSTLWQTPHCSKVSLPLAASPLEELCPAEIPRARVAPITKQLMDVYERRVICNLRAK